MLEHRDWSICGEQSSVNLSFTLMRDHTLTFASQQTDHHGRNWLKKRSKVDSTSLASSLAMHDPHWLCWWSQFRQRSCLETNNVDMLLIFCMKMYSCYSSSIPSFPFPIPSCLCEFGVVPNSATPTTLCGSISGEHWGPVSTAISKKAIEYQGHVSL